MGLLRTVRRSGWLISGVLALSLAVPACGGADSGGGDSGGGSHGAAGATPAAEVLGTPKPATGAPVTIGFISASASDSLLSAQFQRVEQGLQVALKYANQYRGGIAGRPIALFVCQGGETPAGTQDCANQMVNRNVSAVISTFTAQGASVVPVLTKAKIPYMSLSGTSTEELTRPGAFSLTGGFSVGLAAFAAYAHDHGVRKMAMLAIDGPAVLQAVNGIGGIVFRNAGVGFQTVAVPVGTADMTPQMQAAVSGGADAVSMVGDLTFCTSWLQAYQTLGLDLPRYIINTCIDPTTLKAYRPILAGSVMTASASTDAATADATLYGAITRTYDPKIDPDPAVSVGQSSGAITLLSFVNLFTGFTGDPTPAVITARLRAAKNVPLFLGDGTTYTCDGRAVPILPNVCSAEAQIGTVTGDGTVKDATVIETTRLFKP
ncbi:ABC transporter substrate-binding protein [Frankia sp. AiPs1]|uniref:ABC transporter substrate-binding protein n=1 Tax=Frankia sp. AiPs1 TaxID=573493 RepID=UPI002043089E|nr:ABC transporter substrate-binding protein [Frankia sp. AiPs1]MCM3923085.1 ABC transporter substrate-binding protein [Frankia sp. AiPs1]